LPHPFGLSLPKLVLAVATACPCEVREPGVARLASNFLLLRQKKVTKEKATPSLRPLRWRCGANLRRVGCGVRRGTRFAAAQRRSDNHGESVYEAWALRRPCSPRNRPAVGAASRGLGSLTSNSRTPPRAFASLGPILRAQAPRAAQAGPSAAMARMDVRSRWVPFCMRLGRAGRGVACASERACFVN
jgi:hypothetical protein